MTPREEKIVKMRYGLEGRLGAHAGGGWPVVRPYPRERIRQIEAKALRKLRQPARSRKLQSFPDDVHE